MVEKLWGRGRCLSAAALPAAVFSLVSLMSPGSAFAQAPASEIFEPQAVGKTSIWSVATTENPGHMRPSIGVVGHWAHDPVVLRERGGDVHRLLGEQYKLELGLGFGLFDRVELGFVLPLVAYQSGEAVGPLQEPNAIDLAEARAQLRVNILQAAGFGLGAQLTGYLPTSPDAPYQSSDSASLLAGLIADYHVDEGPLPWRVAANIGWALEPESKDNLLQTDDRLDIRLGAEAQVIPQRLSVLASAYGRWEALAEPTHSLSAGYLGGVRYYWAKEGLSSTIGAGGALAEGYGTPNMRVVASLAYTPGEAGLAWMTEGTDERELQPSEDDAALNEQQEAAPAAESFAEACEQAMGAADAGQCSADEAYRAAASAALLERCASEEGLAGEYEDCPPPADPCLEEDDENCPEEDDNVAVLLEDRIEILERVYFDTNRATIKSQSHSLLRQVAKIMKENPDIKLLRVQGHTDSTGNAKLNLELSQQRAASVQEFLVKQGVDAKRLSARGYGQSHPIDDNESEEGRARNRRVEFHIIERDAK